MEKAPTIKSFTDLNAWREGHKLVLSVYRITKKFPKSEMFGLTSQIQRSSVSVTSNIAEGFSRRSWKEKSQFYFLSQGSLTELQNQLLIARDIGYINAALFASIADQTVAVHKLKNGLIKTCRSVIHDT
jgi:four helix bundle protein